VSKVEETERLYVVIIGGRMWFELQLGSKRRASADCKTQETGQKQVMDGLWISGLQDVNGLEPDEADVNLETTTTKTKSKCETV